MKILAVGCHPDDLEINCFGTLHKYAKAGHEVYVCGVANGNLGHQVIRPDELAKIRVAEAKKAAETIGAKEYINLNANDGFISRYDRELTDKTVDVIRRIRPDVLITHYPKDYHMDHEETSALVLNAAFLASLPHYFTNVEGFVGNIPAYYMTPSTTNDFLITDYVDITAEIEVKLNALACHKSQVEWLRDHDNIDLLEAVRSQDRTKGRQCAVTYAEGFKICEQKQKTGCKHLLP